MNLAWIAIGVGIVVVIIGLFTSWRRGGRFADLGAVSNQWIAEHRLGSEQDTRR